MELCQGVRVEETVIKWRPLAAFGRPNEAHVQCCFVLCKPREEVPGPKFTNTRWHLVGQAVLWAKRKRHTGPPSADHTRGNGNKAPQVKHGSKPPTDSETRDIERQKNTSPSSPTPTPNTICPTRTPTRGGPGDGRHNNYLFRLTLSHSFRYVLPQHALSPPPQRRPSTQAAPPSAQPRRKRYRPPRPPLPLLLRRRRDDSPRPRPRPAGPHHWRCGRPGRKGGRRCRTRTDPGGRAGLPAQTPENKASQSAREENTLICGRPWSRKARTPIDASRALQHAGGSAKRRQSPPSSRGGAGAGPRRSTTTAGVRFLA